MKEIGLFEAKTNLSKIAEQVKKTGRPVTLTKRGEPYVDLVPHKPPASRKRTKTEILAEADAFRRRLPPTTSAQIRSAIEEGRR